MCVAIRTVAEASALWLGHRTFNFSMNLVAQRVQRERDRQ